MIPFCEVPPRRWGTMMMVSYALVLFLVSSTVHARSLNAGVAKVDVTNYDAGPVNDPLYVKALVVKDDTQTLIIITVDAVALVEIGPLGNTFLPSVRARLNQELGISLEYILINASHCHGVVCNDVAERTVQAAKAALQGTVPVLVGAGAGHEDRIMENRRYMLASGEEADSRHAYSMPPDEAVVGIGPIDPEIGLLRLNREDGRTLAVVYNFACHPIMGVPGHGNTADIPGFASKVIEENLDDDTLALFLQGFAGDVNPAFYKDTDHPRDAEPLGNLLGLSALRALQDIDCRAEADLRVVNEKIPLPRADLAPRITALESEQTRLLHSLKGTSLNLKTFLPLAVKYGLSPEYPSHYAHRYLHEAAMGREDLKTLDAENRENMKAYVDNIHTMEALTRLQTNLELLRKHQAENQAAGNAPADAEVLGVRIGPFVLVSFPGEPSVQIGLNIKERSPHELTFTAGCTNGYLYYAPTAGQLRNTGTAQEDSDCLLAPEWQQLYEDRVTAILARL